MPVWEDATDGGFVEVVHSAGAGLQQSIVRLTTSGRAMLAATRGTERRT